MHNELLSTSQAAGLLEVSPSAVSRMVKREELVPQVKAPGVRGPMFFARAEVERVKAEREAAAKGGDAA